MPTSSASALRAEARQSLSTSGGIMIGGVRDPAEKAADRTADRVMSMSAPVVRRKCAACEAEEGKVHRKCAACEAEEKSAKSKSGGEEEEEAVHAKVSPATAPVAPGAAAAAASPTASSAIRALGAGKSMPRGQRSFFESRMGADLSRVRVHDGPAANRAARSINARAFAFGHHIAFANGEHRPATQEGMRLMAHELAHIVGEKASRSPLRRDLALQPQGPVEPAAKLTQDQIDEAIKFNKSRLKKKRRIKLIRDIIGLPRKPAKIDADFIDMLVQFQGDHGIAQDGKLDVVTRIVLVEELQAAGKKSAARSVKRGAKSSLFVDIRKKHCGCESELRAEIKSARKFLRLYSECGKDPKVKTGPDVEKCVDDKLGGNTSTLASTDASTGDICNKCERTGPCRDILCAIDQAHERIHSVHVKKVNERFKGKPDEADKFIHTVADWVDDEINSRQTDIAMSKLALNILDGICT
ncbi:MAG: DUF4157 domain-containing protein [Hyphomicrobiales bacterium]|nr:DUF4157 domain-containing protein [Hyphomicrobiales bacterium]